MSRQGGLPCCEISSIGLCLLLGPAAASAQDWPQRPVRLVVPYPAGGGTDTVARVLAQKLATRSGSASSWRTRPGASGMIGAQAVAKGDADGYTFLVASPAEIALNQNLFTDMAYDPLKDLTPITLLAWTPLMLAAHPTFEASESQRNWSSSRARSRSTFRRPGTGSAHHLTGEYVNKLHRTRLVHVPYRGAAPAITDAVGGQVKLTISGMPPVVQFLQAGKLKAIAVTSKQRSPTFPEHPRDGRDGGLRGFRLHQLVRFARAHRHAATHSRPVAKAAIAVVEGPAGAGHPRRPRRPCRSAMRRPSSATSSVRNRRNMRRSSQLTGVKVK